MQARYFFDLGSSTIKGYRNIKGQEIDIIEEKSILFKKGFKKEKGIDIEDQQELFSFFEKIKRKYCLSKENTKVYATGVWRELSTFQQEEIKKKFEKLDLSYEIISHEKENYYFQKAMEGNYNGKRILMVNMGGKTTELVVIDNGDIQDTINLSIGVLDIITNFPNINSDDQKEDMRKIIDFAVNRIDDRVESLNCDCAIHTGGELRFQKLTKYPLVCNNIFEDGIHNKMVSYEDFVNKNKQIFYEMKLDELYRLMPGNPKWMDGAKAGILLGQAIFEKAKVKYIIPSDLNIIHGILKEEN